MAEPSIKITDDGTMVLDWPDSCGDTTQISREVLEEIVGSLNELVDWRNGKRRSLLVPPKITFDPELMP